MQLGTDAKNDWCRLIAAALRASIRFANMKYETFSSRYYNDTDPLSRCRGAVISRLALMPLNGISGRMPKVSPRAPRLRPTKEVSVMAWIEDAECNVLLVRQATGLRLWTLPGGKVKRGESLVKAVKREVFEETGLRVQVGPLLGVLDRRDKDAITLLFVGLSTDRSGKVRLKQKEIQKASYQAMLPNKASPSAKYFWSARKGPVENLPKVRASTHQFPITTSEIRLRPPPD